MSLALRILTRALVLAPLTIAPARGHVEELVSPEKLWSERSLEQLILVLLASTSWLYVRGDRRLWAKAGRGRGVPFAGVLSFARGQAASIVALVSPLNSLGGTLLSAHMAQHGMLVGVALPLLVRGRQDAAFAWALTPFWTTGTSAPVWRSVSRLECALSTPMRATVLHAVSMRLWHAPALFGAAVAGLLGGLVTIAPEPIYTAYLDRAERWGLSALADQQLAGLLMWVPLGVPYVAAGLLLPARMLGCDQGEGVEPASSVPTSMGRETAL